MEIVESFKAQLQAYHQNSIAKIPAANTLINHTMILKKNRLNKFGYSLLLNIKQHENVGNYKTENWGNDKYQIAHYQDPVFLTRTFYKNGKSIFKKSGEKRLYLFIDDIIDKDFNENDYINCPNCGFAESISAIRDGCQYCGTHFEMSDVYPSISNYYFAYEYRSANKTDTKADKRKSNLLVWKKFLSSLLEVPYEIYKMRTGGLKSKPFFNRLMKQYNLNIPYFQFKDKCTEMLTAVLFSDSPDNLPFVNIPNCPAISPDLLDFDSTGFAIDKETSGVSGDIATMNTTFFIDGYFDKNGKIKNTKATYKASFRRNVYVPFNLNFSFTRINCKSCAGVFDAVRNDCCPYCNTKYELQNEEWILTDIKRIR
ncbi:MAG: hypothetical protein MJ172_06290 [Clostridia bacterium]|nr:hypothetical protein [Clostridia bacterium]